MPDGSHRRSGPRRGVVIGSHSIDENAPVAQYDLYTTILEELDRAW